MRLLGLALVGGGSLHTLVFLRGVGPARGLLDVPCYAVYVCLHALVIFAGVKVLKHRENSRRGERVRSGMACMVRETGPHLVGFVACIVLAWALLFLWRRWPFRLTHVDLVASEVHFLDAFHDRPYRAGYATMMARMDAAFAVNLALLFAAFELAVLLKRLRFFRRPKAGTAAAGALAIALFVLSFPAYVEARGSLRSRRFSRHPCELAIKYYECGSCYACGRSDFAISANEEQCLAETEGPPSGLCVPASREQMLGLLDILADFGFFEMERVLCPCDTPDGSWRTLEVTDGRVRHLVSSCYGTTQGTKFDALVGKLTQALGL